MDDREILQRPSKKKSEFIMRPDQITGSPPNFQQVLTNASSNAQPSSILFTRTTPSGQHLPLSAVTTQPTNLEPHPIHGVVPFGQQGPTPHIGNEMRMAINNGGAGYNNEMFRRQFANNHRNYLRTIRSEFAFGMSDRERLMMFRIMQTDAANRLKTAATTGGYQAYESLVNPDAVKALRDAALQWSEIPGNDIRGVSVKDIGTFFDKLVLLVPDPYREAASALANQPMGYSSPLPNTPAAELLAQQPRLVNAMPGASTSTMHIPQVQQGVSLPLTTAQALPFMLSTGPVQPKRSLASTGDYLLSQSDPGSTFKRQRFDEVPQVPQLSGPAGPQPNSSWPASNGMSQPIAHWPLPQPPMSYMPVANNSSSVSSNPQVWHQPMMQTLGNPPVINSSNQVWQPAGSLLPTLPQAPAGPFEPLVMGMSDEEALKMILNEGVMTTPHPGNSSPGPLGTPGQAFQGLVDPWGPSVSNMPSANSQMTPTSFVQTASLPSYAGNMGDPATAGVQAMVPAQISQTQQAAQATPFDPFSVFSQPPLAGNLSVPLTVPAQVAAPQILFAPLLPPEPTDVGFQTQRGRSIG